MTINDKIRTAIAVEDRLYLEAAQRRDIRAMRRHRKAGNRVRGVFLATA
jgi:hypothetical protein